MPPAPSPTRATTGKVFTIGWNVSIGQLDAVEAGTQIVALDQQWGDQAGFGALACAEFLKNGKILPEHAGAASRSRQENVVAGPRGLREDLGRLIDRS